MKQLKLYNTLSREVEDFHPLDAKHVKLYVCGPTVYDYAHIGNARSAVNMDILNRLLRHLYPSVTMVRNITDIDDKIITAMGETGLSLEEITNKYAKIYEDDMKSLGCLAPDISPRATNHIDEMIKLIKDLEMKGFAYEAEGHVLFSVETMPDYGELSRFSQNELEAGARVEVAPYKKAAADFILWKPSDETQPAWDSPWGKGRPGWHIECSAMSEKYLDLPFDIHGGGLDLIFPHHENEIAQSCCATGVEKMANYWVHNGFLQADGCKMSKSLGNFYTVHELLEDFPGEAIRYAMISAHYRQPLDFTKKSLKASKKALDRIYTALNSASDIKIDSPHEIPDDMMNALLDDMNTPKLLSRIHKRVKTLNCSDDREKRLRAKADILSIGALIGLFEIRPEAWLKMAGTKRQDTKEIEALIEERITAKANKDYIRADEIRDELSNNGIILEDSPDGTSWRCA